MPQSDAGQTSCSNASGGAFAQEQALISERRKLTPTGQSTRDVYGLALSGGGIRSATFSLGVLRGMAKQSALHLFDYLSTVSGGGYIGAAFGRLFGEAAQADSVEACLANDASMFLWWLRNNGRYLVPQGAKDDWLAAASAVRGWLSSQFSFLILVLFAAVVTMLPHAGVWAWQSLTIPARQIAWIPSAWTLLALAPALLAFAYMWAYYMLAVGRIQLLISLFIASFVIGWAFYQWRYLGAVLDLPAKFAVALAASVLAGILLLRIYLRGRPNGTDSNQTAILRLRLTEPLRLLLVILATCLAAGILDAGSWWLYVTTTLSRESLIGRLGALAAGLGIVLTAIRAVLPGLQEQSSNAWIRSIDWLRVANVLGILTVVLVLFLSTLGLTFLIYSSSVPSIWFINISENAIPLACLLLLLFALACVVCLTGRQIESLNLGSLHYFYRARLARTYTSLGNPTRFHFPRGAFATADRQTTSQLRRIDEALDGDDIPFSQYQPHLHGGPLHLINCCINQTRDDRTGNYNADRRGIALVVGPCGLETGAKGAEASLNSSGSSLAEWTAVSGAALASGMGFYTRTGVATLLYLSGLRLGYWVQSLLAESRASFSWKLLPKFHAVLAEVFGAFPGLKARYWYVSDGGHFDNTGVYALIKRKVPLIVLVDAAADPDYLFGDVENLVRKAKIDYDADIAFIDPDTLPTLAGVNKARFGTPYSMAAGEGPECMLLARINYPSGQMGTLLIIKPRRTDGMPLDVVGYADRNTAFPQESTANQFFSEEQWESYHALGMMLGQILTPTFLATLPALAAQAKTLSFNEAGPVTDATPTALRPADDRRTRVQKTVRTSLGVGVSLSVLLGAWQAVQNQLHANDASKVAYFNTLKAVIDEVNHECVAYAKVAALLAELREASLEVGDSAATSPEIQNVSLIVSRFCPVDHHNCYREYFPRLYASVTSTLASPGTWYWSPIARPIAPQSTPSFQLIAETRAVAVHAERTCAAPDTQPVLQASVAPSPPCLSSTKTRLAPGMPPNTHVPSSLENPTAASLATSAAVSAGRASERLRLACTKDHQSRKLFPQVYQDQDRADATMQNMLQAARSAGMTVEITEDVGATARRTGNPLPFVWDRPTFLYAAPIDKICAETLASAYASDASVRALPPNLAGTIGSIEFWLPPRN